MARLPADRAAVQVGFGLGKSVSEFLNPQGGSAVKDWDGDVRSGFKLSSSAKLMAASSKW